MSTKLKSSNVLIVVIVFAIISTSPLFHLIGTSYSILIMSQSAVLFSIVLQMEKLKISGFDALLLFLVILSSSITALFYNDVRIILLQSFFIVQFIIASILNRDSISKLTKLITNICIIFLVLAWMSFFYAIVGGKPLITLSIKGFHDFHLFLTSFTNTPIEIWSISGFIRPSVIFDEPGAFSFFICFVVIMREIIGENKLKTLSILLFGFITFSLAHFVFTIIYLVMIYGKLNFKSISLSLILLSITITILASTEFGDAFSKLLLSRLEYDNGSISGDNRTGQLFGNLSLLNFRTFLIGLDAGCVMSIPYCREMYSLFGAENLLSPLVQKGILMSFPYYILIVYFIAISLKDKSLLLFFALALLFFQRPYILNYAYGYYAIIPYLYYKKYIR